MVWLQLFLSGESNRLGDLCTQGHGCCLLPAPFLVMSLVQPGSSIHRSSFSLQGKYSNSSRPFGKFLPLALIPEGQNPRMRSSPGARVLGVRGDNSYQGTLSSSRTPPGQLSLYVMWGEAGDQLEAEHPREEEYRKYVLL